MIRFARLAVLAAIATWLVFSIADALNLRIEYSSFFAGVGAAAIAEVIRFSFANWWSRLTQFYKPQTVKQELKTETTKTPAINISTSAVATLLAAFFATLSFAIERLTNPSPLSVNSFIIPITTALIALILLPILARFSVALSWADVVMPHNERVDRAELKLENEPQKVGPAWELARYTLQEYFDTNIRQVSYIFWLTVSVMVVGFSIIVFGIYQAITSPNALLPATIASTAGVITEFIGATFLLVYRSAISQAVGYTKTLERINSFGMAMQVMDTMPDKAESDDIKTKTKAILTELLVRQGNPEVTREL